MATRNSLAAIALNVRDPEKLAPFYCNALGMQRIDHGGEIAVGYGGEGAVLILRPVSAGPDYQHEPNHRFWKIAITLPNLDLAHEQLVKHGVAATDPRQFREIAYLSHLADPEGHVIELIQHTFAGKPRLSDGDESLAMGGGAQIGLITLRTDDIDAEMDYCLGELGMRLLSRQQVSDHGFDLYFLALTDEIQPNPDVNGVDNREWLWQRPFTTLEFQHRLDGEKVKRAQANRLGAATVIVDSGDGARITFS